jgi:hypothetical protein
MSLAALSNVRFRRTSGLRLTASSDGFRFLMQEAIVKQRTVEAKRGFAVDQSISELMPEPVKISVHLRLILCLINGMLNSLR